MTDTPTRSVAQDAANMNRTLDAIWRMGDRDECSIKHIGWATAAIGSGLRWSDGLDYSRPWAGEETWIKTGSLVAPAPSGSTVFEDWTIIPWTDAVIAMREGQLAKKWAKVEEYRDKYGLDRFDQVMHATKFNWYYGANLADMQEFAATQHAD